MAIIRNLYVYDLGIQTVAGFTAGSALVGGQFVDLSGGDWTIKSSAQSAATVCPIGIVADTVAINTTEVEVVTAGYVRMQTQVAMTAGDAVYPSSVKGRIIKTGKKVSGTTAQPIFAGGFGVVVAGASASGYAVVKLYGLV